MEKQVNKYFNNKTLFILIYLAICTKSQILLFRCTRTRTSWFSLCKKRGVWHLSLNLCMTTDHAYCSLRVYEYVWVDGHARSLNYLFYEHKVFLISVWPYPVDSGLERISLPFFFFNCTVTLSCLNMCTVWNLRVFSNPVFPGNSTLVQPDNKHSCAFLYWGSRRGF